MPRLGSLLRRCTRRCHGRPVPPSSGERSGAFRAVPLLGSRPGCMLVLRKSTRRACPRSVRAPWPPGPRAAGPVGVVGPAGGSRKWPLSRARRPRTVGLVCSEVRVCRRMAEMSSGALAVLGGPTGVSGEQLRAVAKLVTTFEQAVDIDWLEKLGPAGHVRTPRLPRGGRWSVQPCSARSARPSPRCATRS